MVYEPQIATSSVEEGLDFAFNLACEAIPRVGQVYPEKAKQLLEGLASYVQYRYAGELLLAAECLSWLGNACDQADFQDWPFWGHLRRQFWSQMRWVAEKMSLSPEELARLELSDV